MTYSFNSDSKLISPTVITLTGPEGKIHESYKASSEKFLGIIGDFAEYGLLHIPDKAPINNIPKIEYLDESEFDKIGYSQEALETIEKALFPILTDEEDFWDINVLLPKFFGTVYFNSTTLVLFIVPSEYTEAYIHDSQTEEYTSNYGLKIEFTNIESQYDRLVFLALTAEGTVKDLNVTQLGYLTSNNPYINLDSYLVRDFDKEVRKYSELNINRSSISVDLTSRSIIGREPYTAPPKTGKNNEYSYTETYNLGDRVKLGSDVWVSTKNENLANYPTLSAGAWKLEKNNKDLDRVKERFQLILLDKSGKEIDRIRLTQDLSGNWTTGRLDNADKLRLGKKWKIVSEIPDSLAGLKTFRVTFNLKRVNNQTDHYFIYYPVVYGDSDQTIKAKLQTLLDTKKGKITLKYDDTQ